MKDINQQLEDYSKIKFHNNLEKLERDVNKQLTMGQINQNMVTYFMEKKFGMPAFMSASTICTIFIFGILWGAKMQPDIILDAHDALGLDVFNASNMKLPLSLLAFKS